MGEIEMDEESEDMEHDELKEEVMDKNENNDNSECLNQRNGANALKRRFEENGLDRNDALNPYKKRRFDDNRRNVEERCIFIRGIHRSLMAHELIVGLERYNVKVIECGHLKQDHVYIGYQCCTKLELQTKQQRDALVQLCKEQKLLIK